MSTHTQHTQNEIAQHNYQVKIVSSLLVLIALTASICLNIFNQDN